MMKHKKVILGAVVLSAVLLTLMIGVLCRKKQLISAENKSN